MKNFNQKEWYLVNKDRIARYNLNDRQINPKKYLLKKTARNAIRTGRQCDLTTEDFEIPSHCPVLGVPLIPGNKNKGWDNSPSIDRFDSSKNYTKDNIRVISWRANKIKNNGTLEEHKKLVKWMEEETLK